MSYNTATKLRKMSPAQEAAAQQLQNARQSLASKRLAVRQEIEDEMAKRLEVFEGVVMEAVQKCVSLDMSKAAIMRAYGTTDYRTVKNYIDRVSERTEYITEIAPARFNYVGVNERGEIMALDAQTGDNGRIYISWKGDWEHNLYGLRSGVKWMEIPELEDMVAQIESGMFVLESDIARLEQPIRKRISGVESIAASTPVKNEPSLDDWDV